MPLRSPTREPPPPLMRPRELLRLVTLLGMMALIVVAMARFSRPGSWRWITSTGEPAAEVPKEPKVEPTLPARPPVSKPAEPPPKPAVDNQALQQLQIDGVQMVGYWALASMLSTPAHGVETWQRGMWMYDASVWAYERLPFNLPKPIEPDPLPPGLDLKLLAADCGRWVVSYALRRAPVPNPDVLEGALDRRPFLTENQANPNSPLRKEERGDADARYHLIDLALRANLEDLAADGRKDMRYTELIAKPWGYRGEVIHVEGDLISVQPMELLRKVDGLNHVYLGTLEVPATKQVYLILFTELPPNFPPEKRWPELYLRDVRFNGYFLKTAPPPTAGRAKGKAEGHFLPVLIGRTVELPPGSQREDWRTVLWTVAAVLGGVFLLGVAVFWFTRRSDRRYLEKMAEVRRRASLAPEAEGGTPETGLANEDQPPFLFPSDGKPSPQEHPSGRNGSAHLPES